MDCVVAALLAMTWRGFTFQTAERICVRIPAARMPGLCCIVSPEERALGTPGACCTRGLVCKMHKEMRTRAYRYRRSIPTFPAQWPYGLCRALPGDEFVLSPSLPA